MEHQRAEVLDDGHRIHPLPEQVRGVQLDADVGGAGPLDQLADPGRVEHQVLRVQLEGHLDVQVGGLPVDLPPELLGHLPLVVQHVQGGGVPGVDDPVGPLRTGLAAGQTRHRHDPVLAEPVRQPDAAADVVGVGVPDDPVRVQRVAVAVQAGDLHAGALEQAEVVVPRGVGGEDVVEGGDVHGRQEAAGVELDAGQADAVDDLEGLGQRTVVQDRVVDAELHAGISSSWVVGCGCAGWGR